MSDLWDLVVIGGGPAGAATAIIAAQLGCRVLLLEADVFPRHHVGESIVNLWIAFDDLGVTGEMDETFLHKYGATRLWGKTSVPHSTDFSYVPEDRRYALQVERSLFDLILLRRAEAVGAAVCQGHRVREVLWEGERAVGVRFEELNGHIEEARASFVVDASGRDGLLARHRDLREIDPFYPDFSVYGYFRGYRSLPGAQAGNLVVEAVPWGWLWFIPLHTGEVSVGLVCDRTTRSLLQAQGIGAYFEEAIAQSQLVRGLLEGAELVRGPIGTASYGYRSRCYAGPGWMLAGDAGAFFDPMWASGVASALQDGILAGRMVASVRTGRLPEGEAIDLYRRAVSRKETIIDRVVKFVYGANALYAEQPFWQERHLRLEERALPHDLLEHIAGIPFAEYFRAAIVGMGVEDGIGTVLEDGTRDQQVRRAELKRLQQNPADWTPHLAPGVVRHVDERGPTGEITGMSLSVGPGKVYFRAPLTVAAMAAVDGRRNVRQIVDLVLATVPDASPIATYCRIVAVLSELHRKGFLRAAAEVRV